MRSNENRDHWMDHAREKYGRDFVEDVKDFLKVIFMYLPLPVFWALFDQQVSQKFCSSIQGKVRQFDLWWCYLLGIAMDLSSYPNEWRPRVLHHQA